MCKEQGCKIRPSFNIEFDTKPLYCSTHKKEGMINVKDKTCIECKKLPVFNTEGKKIGLYCSTHKKEGMIDVKSKYCLECNKQPVFNLIGEKKLYCLTHKKEGMVDVKHKTCVECKTRPNFNIECERVGLYCSTHKKDGMVDVTHKKCIREGCKVCPTYNYEIETKALYCSQHKLDGMTNVLNKKCIYEGCNKQPSFNIEGETKRLYCSTHKLDGMTDVTHKTCKSEWCLTRVQEKYDGYCLFCYMNLFPDKPVSRNYKTKEYSVVEYVKTKFPSLNWIADKIINGGCSKRRPDLLVDLGYQIIIIETDENQHINYDCSCENKRIMELSQDLGHRPIIFIRFNPDDYDKDGINITSCWGQNSKGICVVKKSKKDEWEKRLNVLENHINYWINPENVTNKTIEIIQLFYDI